jgi:pimeloyl-ACP methyl ester carboxylesterase
VLLPYATTGVAVGPTVLLLHGVGTTSWMWRQLVTDLAQELRVVTVDLPGHGENARTPWTSMADTVRHVADLLRDVAPAGAAHVVGLSLGGYVALELAAEHPELVSTATASGVNVLPFPHPRLMRAAGRVLAPLMTTHVALRANARALGVPPEDVAGYAAAARSMAPGTFLVVGGELMDYALPAGAGRSTTRVLAVAGSEEQALVLQSLPRIAGAFPHGQARIAPGVGHAWNAQSPGLFAAMVVAQVTGAALPSGLSSVPA